MTWILSKLLPRPPSHLGVLLDHILRKRSGYNHALEVSLFTCICYRYNDSVNLSHAIIKSKPSRLKELARMGPSEKMTLKFSTGGFEFSRVVGRSGQWYYWVRVEMQIMPPPISNCHYSAYYIYFCSERHIQCSWVRIKLLYAAVQKHFSPDISRTWEG